MVKAELDEPKETNFPPFHPSRYFELPLIPETKPPGRIQNVILDWYGTLYNCMPLFPVVFGEEMHRRFRVSRELAYRNFRSNPGLSIEEQIEDLLGTERYQRFDETVIEAAENAIFNRLDDLEADIFPDVPGALFRLLRNGYRLSVLSNNKESSLKSQVEKQGLAGFFKFLIGRDTCEKCNDKGEGLVYLAKLHEKLYGEFISESVVVTDTTVDARRFALSGIPIIARAGFTYPHSGTLYRASADWVVKDFRDLFSIVSTM